MNEIASNLHRIRERITNAAARSGRNGEAIRVVAASKAKPVEVIRQAIEAGVCDFGENYVQEAAAKIPACGTSVTWHLIGHLQRNKAARAVELFDLLHAVDSAALGRALGQHGAACGRPIRVLLEVNLGREASKKGIQVDEAPALLAALADEEYLVVDGLMTIPPPGPAEAARQFFRALRRLRDRLKQGAPENAPLRELSMGMSDDYEVAVEEGATMVRIGRALLGERTQPARRSV